MHLPPCQRTYHLVNAVVAIIKFLNIHRSRSLLEKKTMEKKAAARANTNTHTDANTNVNVNANVNLNGVTSMKRSKGDGLTNDDSKVVERERKELASGGSRGSRVSKLGSRSGLGIGKENRKQGHSKEEKKESNGKRKKERSSRGESRRVYRGEKIAADQLEEMEAAFDGELDTDDGDNMVNMGMASQGMKEEEEEEADSESALRKLTQL